MQQERADKSNSRFMSYSRKERKSKDRQSVHFSNSSGNKNNLVGEDALAKRRESDEERRALNTGGRWTNEYRNEMQNLQVEPNYYR
jgi:hypothetical protein